jgi:hypothetical protein
MFSGCGEKSIEIELLHDTSTFDAPVTSLNHANADNALWIGFENGDIVWKKDAEHKIYHADKKARIYDIYDCGDSTLLVGMRNEGIKLYDLRRLKNGAWDSCKIQFTIPDTKENRETRYSIYSIAYDDSTKTFFLGSSNGIYALHSDSLSKSKRDTILLKQRVDTKNEKDSIHVIGFFKIIVNDRFILTQGDKYKYGESNNDKHKYKIANDFPEDSISKHDADILNPQYMQFDGIDSTEYFTLTFNEIKFKKGKQEFVHNQPVIIHEEKNWMRALKHDNFIYVASHRKLYAFFLHQNTAKTANSVLAISSTSDNAAAYFITDDLCLHKYDKTDNHLGKIKGLEGKVKGNILKFISVGDDKEEKFYLATDKHLFEIRGKTAREILWNQNDATSKGDNNKITDIHWANNELYVGSRNFLAKYSKNTLRKITTNGLDTTDLYVVSICGNKPCYVSTLNRGIYKIEDEKGAVMSKFEFYKDNENRGKWDSSKLNIGKFDTASLYGTVLDFVKCGDHFLLNTTKGLVELFYELKKKYYKVSLLQNDRTIKSLFSSPLLDTEKKIYIIFDYKGLKQLKITDTAITEKRKFSDISFDKNKTAVISLSKSMIAGFNDTTTTILLGTEVGLFKWKLFSVSKDRENLIPILIDKPFSMPDWVKFVITLSIVIIAGVFIILVFFRKWKDEQLKKDASNTEIERLKNEEIAGIMKKLKEWTKATLEQIESKWDECKNIDLDSHTFIEKKNKIEQTLSDIKQQDAPNKVDIDNLEQEVNDFYYSYLPEIQIKEDIERIKEDIENINEIYKECNSLDNHDSDRQKKLKEKVTEFINKYKRDLDNILHTEKYWHINHALILCLIDNIKLIDIEDKITYLDVIYDKPQKKDIKTNINAKRIADERGKCLDKIDKLFSDQLEYENSAILKFMQQKYIKDRKQKK